MTIPNYEEMLNEAEKILPKKETTEERFQIPKVKGHLQGNKTVISNLTIIADILHRPIKHLIKYLTKELASGADQINNLVIFNTKIPASRINEKISEYAKEFVMCRECGKPDSKLAKEGEIYYFRCQACGARYTFTAKI